MATEELKSCPFCGSYNVEVELFPDDESHDEWYAAVCQECGGSSGKELDLWSAKETWNRRA